MKQISDFRFQISVKDKPVTGTRHSVLAFCLFAGIWYLASGICSEAAFKDTGWGVRPAGMGGAFIGIADDASAGLWNPAGLGQINKREGTFMYAKPYAGLPGVNLGLATLGFVYPVPRIGVVGFSWANFTCAGTYQENTALLTYAVDIMPYIIPESGLKVYTGLNLKLLNHRYIIGEEEKEIYYRAGDSPFEKETSASAFTVDIGFLIKPIPRLAIGLAGKNLLPANVGLAAEDKVPMEGGIGVGYKFVLPRIELNPGLDFSYRAQTWGKFKNKGNIRFGSEAWLLNHRLAVRAGINLNEFTAGASYNHTIKKFLLQIDYASIFSLTVPDNYGTHRVGMTLRF